MKKSYSLFIGRYSPPHLGHKTIFESVLNEGKNVCIAIRDTERTMQNPYSYRYRKRALRKMLQSYGNRVRIVRIPDIGEVCYGRKVGWGIREIKVSPKIQAISATEIRANESGS